VLLARTGTIPVLVRWRKAEVAMQGYGWRIAGD
jgi:hypothetical protein